MARLGRTVCSRRRRLAFASRRQLAFEPLEERALLDGGTSDASGAGASLEPVAAGRIAYHSYTDYGVDGELHVWNFADAAADARAEGTVNARVRYAMNPQFSGNGRYLVLMGVDRQLPKAWPNLDIFIYDFRTDTVTNLTKALIAAGFLAAGNDWIDEDPSFDPTSLTIAFKRRSGGNSDLWSMKLDGTARVPIAFTRLTNTPGVEESGPKFAPDGQTIVCWVGAGASSYIASLPAVGGAVSQVANNANRQDYFPSYWGPGRILYTSWDTNGSGDDDIRVRDLASGNDVFGLGGFHSPGEDSDAFAISQSLIAFSSSYQSADGKWRLLYGDPTTGETAAFPFHTANKHDLGGTYTPQFVSFAPGPERSELPGDYNHNLVVDAADYSVWRDTLGSTVDLRADGSGPTAGVPDGVVDERDYAFWKLNFGNVLSSDEGGASIAALEPPVIFLDKVAAPADYVGSAPAIGLESVLAASDVDGALVAWLLQVRDQNTSPTAPADSDISSVRDFSDSLDNGSFDSAFAALGSSESSHFPRVLTQDKSTGI